MEKERAAAGTAPRKPCPKCNKSLSKSNISKHRCGSKKPKKTRQEIQRASRERNKDRILMKQREDAAFRSFEKRKALRVALQTPMPPCTAIKPTLNVSTRSIFKPLSEHPEVVIAISKLILEKAKPNDEDEHFLTKKWLIQVLRHVHVDKGAGTLTRAGVTPEAVEAARQAHTAFTQSLNEMIGTVEALTQRDPYRHASLEGGIRHGLHKVFHDLVPAMVKYERAVENHKRSWETKVHRVEGYLKRYQRFDGLERWEEYRDAYLRGAADKARARNEEDEGPAAAVRDEGNEEHEGPAATVRDEANEENEG